MNSSNTSNRLVMNRLSNTRDLGGVHTTDGRTIKSGLLYRSGHLFFADAQDVEQLKLLGIRRIYDFRSLKERTDKPDPVIGEETNLHIPIMRDLTAGITREEQADKESADMLIEQIKIDPKFGANYMADTYLKMVSDEYAISQYAYFLRDVASVENGAVLWHCTAGKDRAGFAAVLIQEILGVDRADIMEDYLATNEYIREEIEQILVMLEQKIGIQGAEDAIRQFFGADEQYLDSIYAYVDTHYGSMNAFIENALGVDAQMKQCMQRRFLE